MQGKPGGSTPQPYLRPDGAQRTNAKGESGWRLRWTPAGGGAQQARVFYGLGQAATDELNRLTGTPIELTTAERRVALYGYLTQWQRRYKAECERRGLARSTWKEHESNTRLYLLPTLEGLEWDARRLAAFTADELFEVINSFSLIRVDRDPSDSMRKSVRKTLVMALGQALKDGVISVNPIQDSADWTVGNPTVFVPDLFQLVKVARIMGSMPSLAPAAESTSARNARLKTRRQGQASQQPPRVRTGEPRPWLEWMLLTAGWTGLRVGELLALRMDDVDTNNRLIVVSRNATVSGGRYKEGAPKTDSGKRIVPILPDAEKPIVALEDRAEGMNATHLFVGAGKKASRINAKGERVTVKAAGAIGYSELSRELRQACAIAVEQGVIPKPFTWHSCRHTFCSALLSSGVSEDKVASWAGHSSAEVTKRVYSVALPGNMESVAAEVGAQIADYFGNRRSTRTELDAQMMRILEKVNPEAATLLKGKGKGKAKKSHG